MLQLIRSCRFGRSAMFGICALLPLIVACTDFPEDPAPRVTVQQPPDAQWPQELFVKDTSLLTIDVDDDAGTVITGLQVEWQSTDASVLELRPVEPAGQTHQDSLVAQRSVRAVAQRRGTAEISARIVQPGIEPAVLGQEVRVMERWIAVSAGYTHTCGLTIDHDAYCWGSGLLGNGSAVGSTVPVPVGIGLRFQAVTAGNGHTCGILLDGTVECWGSNSVGALGNGSAGDQALPVLLSAVSILHVISAGDNYVCGVATEMRAFCWGNNESWQLGDAFLNPITPPDEPPTGIPSPKFDNCGADAPVRCSRTPRQVRGRGSDEAPNGTPLVLSGIAPGVSHTCALRPDGQVLCWGTGSVQMGSPDFLITDSTSAIAAVPLPGGLSFLYIASGSRHTCAIRTAEESIYCWGFNSHGQLGTASSGSSCPTFSTPPTVGCSPVPTAIAGGLRFDSLDAGGNSNCGIAADSAAYCWGSNEFGQLGEPDAGETCDAGTACRTSAVKVDLGGQPIRSLSVGSRHACGVTIGGAVFCWGDSSDGKLGTRAVNGELLPPTRVAEPD